MKKISVILLRKNRTIERLKVSPDDTYFKRRGNLYTLPKEAVNLVSRGTIPSNPISELIFVEGNPTPQCFSGTSASTATNFLETLVIQNALKTVGKPKGFGFEILLTYLKDPSKLLLLTFVAIIIVAVVGGFLYA